MFNTHNSGIEPLRRQERNEARWGNFQSIFIAPESIRMRRKSRNDAFRLCLWSELNNLQSRMLACRLGLLGEQRFRITWELHEHRASRQWKGHPDVATEQQRAETVELEMARAKCRLVTSLPTNGRNMWQALCRRQAGTIRDMPNPYLPCPIDCIIIRTAAHRSISPPGSSEANPSTS